MPCSVGNATITSLSSRIFVITPREPFAILFYVSIVLVRNMTLAPTLQVTTSGKFVPLLKILE
jgi:hypothetical protein